MHVESLFIHPVKSMKAGSVRALDLGRDGPRLDRHWLVIDAHDSPVSIRDVNNMVLVSARVADGVLRLSADSHDDCAVPVDGSEGTPWRMTLYDSEVEVAEVSAEASAWLSGFLGQPVRIVHKTDAVVRYPGYGMPPLYELQFADLGPLLVTNTRSLADLNERLSTPITMERFRPNVVIDGAEAWEEDTWKEVRIGDTEFKVVGPDMRCAVVNVDPATGERSNEPLRTMASFRRRERPFPGVYFGMYFRYDTSRPARIEQGAAVEVLERSASG